MNACELLSSVKRYWAILIKFSLSEGGKLAKMLTVRVYRPLSTTALSLERVNQLDYSYILY